MCQLLVSAVIECADAAHGLGCLIVADGGCKCPGDVAKVRLVTCSHLCALNSPRLPLLSLSPPGIGCWGGLLVERDGEKFKQFYGMSSTRRWKNTPVPLPLSFVSRM